MMRFSARADTDKAPRVLFLCGFPSSGTDLLKNVVNAHSKIFVGGEFPLLPSLARKYSAEVERGELAAVLADLRKIDIYGNLENSRFTSRIGTAQRYSFERLYIDLLTNETAEWMGNKTPQNSENVPELRRLFPDACFLLIVRDVRDVALSWRSKWGKDMILCADKWQRRMRACLRSLESIDRSHYEVIRYEDLLKEPEQILRGICRWLRVEFEPGLLSFHESVQKIVPGKINYGKPIIPENLEKWREGLPPAVVRRIEEVSFAAMRELGYAPAYAERSRPITSVERTGGLLRDAWAMVAVGNRALGKRQLSYRLRAIRLELKKRL